MEVTDEGLARFFEVVQPHMNEVQRRVVAGAAAEMLGRGGKTAVANASGFNSMIEFTAGPCLSMALMRARYFLAIERAVNLPDFISFWRAAMVTSSNSKGGTRLAEALGGAAIAAAPLSIPARRKLRRFSSESWKDFVISVDLQ